MKLVPELYKIWEKNGFKESGNWEDIFGSGVQTDEIFMAWYYAKYVNRLAEAGKKIYQLPMYVNAALNRPNRLPGIGYPSAGPLPHLMDIWKAAGNSIDFLAPDIYFPNFKYWCDLYVRQGDPLFIPEHKNDNTAPFKGMFAIGHYNTLGFSPFSIESTAEPENNPLGKIYNIITQLSLLITENQPTGKVEGVLLNKQHKDTTIIMGKYILNIRHDYTLGWGVDTAAIDSWPLSSAIIIQTSENEFYFGGTGIVATFKSATNNDLNIGILKVDEGKFENAKWKILLHLNGDETHQGRHLRIPYGQYSIQRIELYQY